MDNRSLDEGSRTVCREVWILHVRERECQDYARRRIYLCPTLQERVIGDEWMEDGKLQGPEEACDCVRRNAYSATATHDLCHRMARQLLQTRLEGKANSLGEDLQHPNLDQCQHSMEGGLIKHIIPYLVNFY